MAKVSCILRHQGIQLILAYSWARLAILVAGKGRGECCYAPAIFNGGVWGEHVVSPLSVRLSIPGHTSSM